MNDVLHSFIWGDHGCYQNGQWWFAGTEVNALFHLDFGKEQCFLVDKLPGEETISFFRNIQKSIAYKDKVIGLPDRGKNIICYDTKENHFSKVVFDAQNEDRVGIVEAFWYKERIFCVSDWRIFEYDPAEQKLLARYELGEEIGYESVQVNESIYCVSHYNNLILEFNMCTKQLYRHILDGADKGFNTICYDGQNFVLAGYSEKVYFWNPKTQSITNINLQSYGLSQCCFHADQDGERLPIFMQSFVFYGNVWLIPRASHIVIINEEKRVRELHIPAEDETPESLRRSWNEKYSVQYIREDCYLGIYSFKNKYLFEIDTRDFSVLVKHYRLDEDSKKRFLKLLIEERGNFFYEGKDLGIRELLKYWDVFEEDNSAKDNFINRKRFGTQIYKLTREEQA